jgi:hypothetical protein
MCFAASALAQEAACACADDMACYERGRFRVRRISFETLFGEKTPLSFIFAARQMLLKQSATFKSQIPLKEGEEFTFDNYSASQVKLRRLLEELRPGERFRFVYFETFPRACETTTDPPTVEIVFRLLSSDGVSFLTTLFERRPDRITRSLLSLIPLQTIKQSPLPQLGYNRSRGLFGGARGSFSATGGLFNRVDYDVSGSSSSAVADLGLIGGRDFDDGLINHAEWRLGYRYANLPSDTVRLKEGTLLAQFFAGTRPLARRNLALRFGASVEGGNRQSELAGLAVSPGMPPADDLEQSRYGAIKLYLGATMSGGRQGAKVSYGLQLGETGDGVKVDYLKHILDAAYSIRFLPYEHRPLRVETQFSAGWIQSFSGRIPLGERFFGGDLGRDFIQGDDWRIRSSPVIRSFPQNRLNRIGAGLPVGGENFVAANVTLAQTVWGRPLVPREIARNDEVRAGLGLQLVSMLLPLREDHLAGMSEQKKIIDSSRTKLKELFVALTSLASKLEAMRAQPQPDAVKEALSMLENDPALGFDPVSSALDDVTQAKDVDKNLEANVRALVMGFEIEGEPRQPVALTRAVIDLANLQTALREAGLDQQEKEIGAGAATLDKLHKALKEDLVSSSRLRQIDPEKMAPFRSLLDDVSVENTAASLLARIEKTLAEIKTGDDKDLDDEVLATQSYVQTVSKVVKGAVADLKDALSRDAAEADTNSFKGGLDRLLVGFGEVSPALLPQVAADLQLLRPRLIQAGRNEEARQLDDQAGKLSALHARMLDGLRRLRETEAQLQARRDPTYKFTLGVLNTIFRELNIVAISPVVMFDVARIGPQTTPDLKGLRYGIGAGARFSLVTFDLTMGYSWNPTRQPGEGRGAFVFSMDISDLFR